MKWHTIKVTWMILMSIATIILVALVVWFVIVPHPIKYLIARQYMATSYTPNEHATVAAAHTLYSLPSSLHRRLVVVLGGGAFLYHKRAAVYGFMNLLSEKLRDQYDLVTVDYGVRFESTIQQALRDITRNLTPFLHYPIVHIVGISAGALLAGAFYQKEASTAAAAEMGVQRIGMTVKSFSGLSGLYSTKFANRLINNLFQWYIMRSTPARHHYTCYGMNIPKLCISSSSDFLVDQTRTYVTREPSEHHIYESTTLPHAFAQLINLSDARDAIDRVARFICKSDGVRYEDIAAAPPTPATAPPDAAPDPQPSPSVKVGV